MACLHNGSAHQHRDGIKETVEKIRTEKDAFLLIVGDLVDGMEHSDPRYQKKEKTEQSILDQYNDVSDLFKTVRSKILCVWSGNHDYRSWKFGDFVKGTFCKNLEVPYGTTAGKVIINRNKKSSGLMYKLFAYHPFNGSIGSTHADAIMREAVEKCQVKRKLASQLMGDCILNFVAHFHKAVLVPPVKNELFLVDDGVNVKQKYHKEADPTSQFIDESQRWYASVPGYEKKHLMGNSGYVERGGYKPVELGCIRAFIVNGKPTHMDKVLV